MCTSQLPKPRPPKIVFLLQLVSRDRIRHSKKEKKKRVREVYCYCTLILRQALFCHQKFVISSLFPLINWKCPQQYLQRWSELTLVPKDVNLRKMLTSKVKITRVNWTGPSYSSGTLLLRTPPNYRGEPAPEASGSSTMIALREMHASAKWPDRIKLPF